MADVAKRDIRDRGARERDGPDGRFLLQDRNSNHQAFIKKMQISEPDRFI